MNDRIRLVYFCVRRGRIHYCLELCIALIAAQRCVLVSTSDYYLLYVAWLHIQYYWLELCVALIAAERCDLVSASDGCLFAGSVVAYTID